MSGHLKALSTKVCGQIASFPSHGVSSRQIRSQIKRICFSSDRGSSVGPLSPAQRQVILTVSKIIMLHAHMLENRCEWADLKLGWRVNYPPIACSLFRNNTGRRSTVSLLSRTQSVLIPRCHGIYDESNSSPI